MRVAGVVQEDVGVDEPRRGPAPPPSEAQVLVPVADSSPAGTRRGGEQRVSSGAEIAARALRLATAGSDPPAAVAELLTLAGSRRRPLEEAHFVLVERLHRRSDDFAATTALPFVSAALWNVGWPPSTLAKPGRKRRRSRLPWQRRP